jgi:hypothetical protein
MENPIFEFESGGVYYFQEYGRWKIKLDVEERFSIIHNVRDKAKEQARKI